VNRRADFVDIAVPARDIGAMQSRVAPKAKKSSARGNAVSRASYG